MAIKASDTITLVKVSDGATGPAGKGIKSTVITYQASTSGTTAPTGTWVSSVPTVAQGQYLWSRTIITYTDNTTSIAYSVAFIPKNGATGATGTGVDSIAQQYYLSTSKTAQSGGSWGTSMPTWSSGKYLWTRYAITYKNPTSTAYTSPICDSSWEAANEVQNDLDSVKVNNLMINGYGSMKSNYNFNGWTFDGNNTYNNVPSFYYAGTYTERYISYNKIPIDVSKSYEFSMNLKANTSEKIYLGFDEYDIDGFKISATYCMGFKNSTTTLAKELKNGDTVVYLTSASGWFNSTLTHQLGLIFWNYKDSTGYQYPEGVYSRNAWLDLYTSDNVNKTNHTITLKSAWTHGTFPAGTKVSQSNSGGHKYFNYTNTVVPTEWSETKWKISGITDLYSFKESSFNPAAKYINFVVLHNYGNGSTSATTYINSVRLADVTVNEAIDSLEETTNEQLGEIIDGLKTAEIAIDNIENTIKLLVVDENGETMVTQDGEGLRVDMAPIINKINNAIDRLGGVDAVLANQNGELNALQNEMETVSELSSYVQIKHDEDTPYIELGNNSSFKVKITNTAILFMNGGDIPAYMDKDKLLIRSAEIEDELVFGGFAFKERENGNMGLIWKE